MKKYIPNLITLLNLLSGTLAVILASQGRLIYAGYFVILGILFDFFDGFAARMLKAESELGMELDSLADLITSGLAPGIVMLQLLRCHGSDWTPLDIFEGEWSLLPFAGLILSLSAAFRLAKFNLNEDRNKAFIGLPTPAMSLFVISIPLTVHFGPRWMAEILTGKIFLLLTILTGSYLMNSPLSMFTLKFKDFSLKNNGLKYVFILLTVVLLGIFKFGGIPLVILLYILVSIFKKNPVKAEPSPE